MDERDHKGEEHQAGHDRGIDRNATGVGDEFVFVFQRLADVAHSFGETTGLFACAQQGGDDRREHRGLPCCSLRQRLTALDVGPVSAEVTIALAAGGEITATMTSAAAKRLKLKKGKEALALIKASAIVLVTDFAGWQLSARNQLAGTVSRIEHGAVSSLVVLTLPGGAAITASVTNEGGEALGLKVGTAATAVFKAYSVMVAAQP